MISVAFFPEVNLVIDSITSLFSSSFSSAGTLHLPSSFNWIPDEFRGAREASCEMGGSFQLC